MLTLALLVSLSSTPAFARAVNDDGNRIKWPVGEPIGVFIAPGLAPTFGPALDAALATWNAPACTKTTLRRVKSAKDAQVVVDTRTPWTAGDKVPAYTEVDSQPSGRADAARVFIDVKRPFGPRPQELDPETVVAHELGHVLGLDHTPNRLALMHAGIHLGQRRQTLLTADDESGACAVLGDPGATPTERKARGPAGVIPAQPEMSPAPARSPDAPAPKKSACGCAATGAAGPAVFGLGAIALVGLVRRRRRA